MVLASGVGDFDSDSTPFFMLHRCIVDDCTRRQTAGKGRVLVEHFTTPERSTPYAVSAMRLGERGEGLFCTLNLTQSQQGSTNRGITACLPQSPLPRQHMKAKQLTSYNSTA